MPKNHRTGKIEDFLKAVAAHDSDECLIWHFTKGKGGYGVVSLNGKMTLCHRLAYKLHYGEWPMPCGCHSCDNRLCFNWRHIWPGTVSDNIHDCVRKGRQNQAHGEKHFLHKLTADQVRFIKQQCDTKAQTHRALALQFGVREPSISAIHRGLNWKHLFTP